jgi:hypothetical protein
VGVPASSQDFSAAFQTIDKERADALHVEAQAATYRHVQEIAQLAGTRKIPSVFEFREGRAARRDAAPGAGVPQ